MKSEKNYLSDLECSILDDAKKLFKNAMNNSTARKHPPILK